MRTRILLSVLISFFITSCTNDKEEGVYISDATLFNLSKIFTSFTYYKNKKDTFLKADRFSPHKSFVRIRFNPKAVSAMDSAMDKLLSPVFPDESMIVKEVYDTIGGPLKGYAIMYKLHSASNNGSGWVWSELYPDGNVSRPAALKGDECIFYHSLGVNSDLVKTFGLH